MIVRSLVIGLVLLFTNWSSALAAQTLSINKRDRNQLECDPIGRVLNNGDRRFVAGSLLCSRDWLQSKRGATVKVLCYASRKILRLKSGAVSAQCTSQVNKVLPCTPDNRSYCPKPKGPGEGNSPALISPYSSLILNQRPSLSWYAVMGATSYTVTVSGEDINWQKTVTGTQISYPKEQPALKLGHTYKIVTMANRNDSAIGASTAVVNVLPLHQARIVWQTAKSINYLNLPPDEAVFDLDAIYMSKALLSEAIKTLESRVASGSQDPRVYRTLGDRYLQAGLPDYAKPQYEIASELAKKSADANELAKAQAGLKLVALHSQLPMRRNPAQ